jgi:hypothetical protein
MVCGIEQDPSFSHFVFLTAPQTPVCSGTNIDYSFHFNGARMFNVQTARMLPSSNDKLTSTGSSSE